MASLGGFDASQVAPSEAFEVIPPGKYKVQVVDSDIRSTKDGNGSYLWLELEILDGEQQGRKLWDRITLNNSNQQAVEIGQRQLSALCHACGKLRPGDSSELHGIPVIATVRVRPPRDGYDASNELRGYGSLDGSAPAAHAPAAPARPAAAAPAATAPWKTRKAG